MDLLFQNIIGNLMYAMVYIRLNIAHAMGVVNQFMANSKQSHWIVMKQFFCYLKGIVDFDFFVLEKNMKDVIMGTVHSNENVNHSLG